MTDTVGEPGMDSSLITVSEIDRKWERGDRYISCRPFLFSDIGGQDASNGVLRISYDGDQLKIS